MKTRALILLSLAALSVLLVAAVSTYLAEWVVFDDGETLQAKFDGGDLGGGGGSIPGGVEDNGVCIASDETLKDCGYPGIGCSTLAGLSDVTAPVLGNSNRIRYSIDDSPTTGHAVCFDANGNHESCGVPPGGLSGSFAATTLTDPASISLATVDSYRYVSIVYTAGPPDSTLDLPSATSPTRITFVNNSGFANPAQFRTRSVSLENFPDLFPRESLSLVFDGTNWVRDVQTSYPMPPRSYGCFPNEGRNCPEPVTFNATQDRWIIFDDVRGSDPNGIYSTFDLPVNVIQLEGAPGTYISVWCDRSSDTLTHEYIVEVEWWARYTGAAGGVPSLYTGIWSQSAEADYTDGALGITPSYELGWTKTGTSIIAASTFAVEPFDFEETYTSGDASAGTSHTHDVDTIRSASGYQTSGPFSVSLDEGECLGLLGYVTSGTPTVEFDALHVTFSEVLAE